MNLCACGNAATASYLCKRHGYVCAQHRDSHLKEQTLVPNYAHGDADRREELHHPTPRDADDPRAAIARHDKRKVEQHAEN